MKYEGRGLHRKEGERLKSIRRVSSCKEIEKKPEDKPERGDTKGEFLNNFQTDYSLEPGGCVCGGFRHSQLNI